MSLAWSEWAFVALGSNLGSSIENIRRAMTALSEFSTQIVLKSSLWRTTPVDCPSGSGDFINAVAAISPAFVETPESLLFKLQRLEKHFGRAPKLVINEARPLDIDLLTFRDEVRQTPELTIPHPRAHLRRFVLAPLAEIAPDLILTGQKESVRDLLTSLESASSEIVEKIR
ncbi:MAG TPA: 2-amino-4-hydroxy-6-hydroxymethyldihydropteridine diphosphokinase [Verrucomicrobiae bacterium]|jgi:2-amino-4-hydroxy-6-hydroxymethyldihydropteridine diphosphokinase|nr:2-amino-4-hydroxy-6-hydroxymethyldihydropteridine diphosphokinase [Verrucomicrobiae bacterium]